MGIQYFSLYVDLLSQLYATLLVCMHCNPLSLSHHGGYFPSPHLPARRPPPHLEFPQYIPNLDTSNIIVDAISPMLT